MLQSRRGVWLVGILGLAALIGLAAGGFYWLNRPAGLAAIPNPAVVAPGAFRASIGDDNTITVGLEVRSVADAPLTLVRAQITPPPGLTSEAVSIIPPGPENEGFALDGPLPPAKPVRLGIGDLDRTAIVAARFTVDCKRLPASDAPTGEQIFVTIQVGDARRVEELTPPVVGDLPWLTATAQRLCNDPPPTGTPEPPDPPLPGTTQSPKP
jgi:hypothetical protein